MPLHKISFHLSAEFKEFINAYAEAEGYSTEAFLRHIVATRLEWPLSPVDEPAPKASRSMLTPEEKAARKRQHNNKRGDAIQRAIEEARARKQRREEAKI